MKFIVSSSALLKQISSINGVITTNPVVPILENFLFEITEGKLVVTASDLQTSMGMGIFFLVIRHTLAPVFGPICPADLQPDQYGPAPPIP